MIKKHSVFIFFFFSLVGLQAQLSDYYSIGDVRRFRFDKLNIANAKDANAFLSQASEFNFVNGLKIESEVNLKAILDRTKDFYELNELNLKNYKGDLNLHTFDSCEEVEVLHLSLDESKLAQLESLKTLKKLQVLYLYIHGKPESVVELKYLNGLKELHLIGDFLPKTLTDIVEQIKPNPMLRTLGISVDRITDLPKNLNGMRFLSDFIVYDNLSVFSNGGIEDLTEEKVVLTFALADDLMSGITVHYMSNGTELAAFETAYLEKLYKGQVYVEKKETATDELVEGEEKFFIPFRKEFNPNFTVPVEFKYPFNDIKPKEEIFKIDPTKHAVITTKSGLRLIIAQNSFSALNSESVTESIYIKICELVSTSDLLFGGVNLKAGQQYYNNKYIVNVQATTATSEVSLKPNYQIKAILPVSKDSTLEYFYDYESYTWQDLAMYNMVFSSTLEPIDFYKIENQNTAVNYVLFDTASFQTRFQSGANYFLNDRLNDLQLLFNQNGLYSNLDRSWIKDYNKSGRLKGLRVKKGKALVKLQKVTPKKRNKERQYFKLIDRTEQHVFSELKVLKNINFNVKTNPEDKRELTDNFIKDYKYQDVRLDYKLGQSTVTILLKYADGYKKLTAFISDAEDDKTLKKHIKKFYKIYKKYLHVLQQRNTSFNENNVIRYNEYLNFVSEKVKANERNGMAAEIRMNQLGTFSLFTLKPVEFNTNIIAQYTDETGIPIDVKQLFMVDSRYQTIIPLDFKNLALTPSTCQLIFATDYSGDIYFANKSDIVAANLVNNSLTYIKLNKIKVKLKTIEGFNYYIR